jgi:hypothetical protein
MDQGIKYGMPVRRHDTDLDLVRMFIQHLTERGYTVTAPGEVASPPEAPPVPVVPRGCNVTIEPGSDGTFNYSYVLPVGTLIKSAVRLHLALAWALENAKRPPHEEELG